MVTRCILYFCLSISLASKSLSSHFFVQNNCNGLSIKEEAGFIQHLASLHLEIIPRWSTVAPPDPVFILSFLSMN